MEKDERNLRIELNAHSTTLVCARIRVTGIVQGVGFRPFVFRLATEMGLSGSVCNKGGAVEIEITANGSGVHLFLGRLQSEAPPVARIERAEIIELTELEDNETKGQFKIGSSEFDILQKAAEIPPDIATCEDCLTELFDKRDRRYRYPFLNCTNCGPRFTVIERLPYDRVSTSMACFAMCPECNDEYSDPLNRRFHAQPNACRSCGPTLAFVDLKTFKPESLLFEDKDDQALAKAIIALSEGQILALKGLGGFQLVCDATNDGAVAQLRKRKGREAKPFAIMMPSEECLANYCHVSTLESAILHGQFRPIVLLKKRLDGDIHTAFPSLSEEVAPQMQTLGVMLPYTPLHHLLLHDYGKPLVMTSANVSEEPIAAGNREALRRLHTLADVFLLHNRDIISRYDDTVTRVMDDSENVVRRARGYAPRSIELGFRATIPVLSMGGHLKNTFCLIKDTKAYVSQHVGDLDTLETLEHFENTLRTCLQLFDITPELLAVDMHPEYGSTKLAQSWLSGKTPAPFKTGQILQTIAVQHHHAHIASILAEHRINEPVIGVAFDGIGYGADQTLWGGEFLCCNFESFDRVAMFKTTRMPGGVSAIKEPWRMALSYLACCSEKTRNSKTVERILDRFGAAFGKQNVLLVYSKLSSSDSSVQTSSCGRLFDAVAALLGLCEKALYEGHAAVVLEGCAANYDQPNAPSAYPFKQHISINEGKEIVEIDPTSIIECVIEDMASSVNNEIIAARFHETIATVIATICNLLRTKLGINKTCLSGGVFQNERLLSRTKNLLTTDGFKVYTNNQVPANDGGLSLGQAVIALAQAQMIEV